MEKREMTDQQWLVERRRRFPRAVASPAYG
jgi:hypothetical protein